MLRLLLQRQWQQKSWLRQFSLRATQHQEKFGEEMRGLFHNHHTLGALRVLFSADQIEEWCYISVFKSCIEKNALCGVMILYSHLAPHGLLPESVSDHLILALVRCGALEDAYSAFISSPQHTVFASTALIAGYANQELSREALQMYNFMLENSLEPDKYTYASLFKACGSMSDLQQGCKLHGHVLRAGLESDAYISCAIVAMYGRCGCVTESETTFNRLSVRNVVSWNAMLSAYVDEGVPHKALSLFRQMQDEAVESTAHTFLMTFQACYTFLVDKDFLDEADPIKEMCLTIGRSLHVDAQRKGFLAYVPTANTLIMLYAKCGAFQEASNVFQSLVECNVYSWHGLLLSYLEQGQEEKVLQLYRKIQEEGIAVDRQTVLTTLQACSSFMESKEMDRGHRKSMIAEIGKAIHVDAQTMHLVSDMYICNTLISMYGKCGRITEAEALFIGLEDRNIVSWNAMLTALIDYGYGGKALRLYRQLQEERVKPNQQTFLIIFQSCGENPEEDVGSKDQVSVLKFLHIGRALHADVQRLVHVLDTNVCNSLITMYKKCRSGVEAENVFNTMPRHNVVSWSALIAVYIEQGHYSKALRLYKQMHEEGCNPNHRVIVITIQSCSFVLSEKESSAKSSTPNIAGIEEVGKALHLDAQKKGVTSNVFISSALISFYGKCGEIEEAQKVYWPMAKNAVCWCAMLSAYVENDEGVNALQMYIHVQDKLKTLDDITIICLLQACAATGSMEICMQLHFVLVFGGLHEEQPVANTLIRAYGSCSSMACAQAAFDIMPTPDIVSWNACVAGYAQQGDCTTIDMFEEMQAAGIEIDGVAFLSVMTACGHASLVHRGMEYFTSMSSNFDIKPSGKHYLAMVNVLGRAGDFEALSFVLSGNVIRGDSLFWMCLLGACREHGNVELGEWAFDHAVALNLKDSSPYILMSNLYTDVELQGLKTEVQNFNLEDDSCGVCFQDAL